MESEEQIAFTKLQNQSKEIGMEMANIFRGKSVFAILVAIEFHKKPFAKSIQKHSPSA